MRLPPQPPTLCNLLLLLLRMVLSGRDIVSMARPKKGASAPVSAPTRASQRQTRSSSRSAAAVAASRQRSPSVSSESESSQLSQPGSHSSSDSRSAAAASSIRRTRSGRIVTPRRIAGAAVVASASADGSRPRSCPSRRLAHIDGDLECDEDSSSTDESDDRGEIRLSSPAKRRQRPAVADRPSSPGVPQDAPVSCAAGLTVHPSDCLSSAERKKTYYSAFYQPMTGERFALGDFVSLESGEDAEEAASHHTDYIALLDRIYTVPPLASAADRRPVLMIRCRWCYGHKEAMSSDGTLFDLETAQGELMLSDLFNLNAAELIRKKVRCVSLPSATAFEREEFSKALRDRMSDEFCVRYTYLHSVASRVLLSRCPPSMHPLRQYGGQSGEESGGDAHGSTARIVDKAVAAALSARWGELFPRGEGDAAYCDKSEIERKMELSALEPVAGAPGSGRSADAEAAATELLLSPVPTYLKQQPQKLSRQQAFALARQQLELSAMPQDLPCREDERREILGFLLTHLESTSMGGNPICYLAGMPGTGKSATVAEVLRVLRSGTELGECPPFSCLSVNGMMLRDASSVYPLLWGTASFSQQQQQQRSHLGGVATPPAQAHRLLNSLFTSQRAKRVTTVLILDELDAFLSLKDGQTVLYHLLEWCHAAHSRLVMVAIANTMDLPERTMIPKVRSRFGSENRITFAPYTQQQLALILSKRLEGMVSLGVVEASAVKLVAAKAAAVTGDCRRALALATMAISRAEEMHESTVTVDLVDSVARANAYAVEKMVKSLPEIGRRILGVLLGSASAVPRVADASDHRQSQSQFVLLPMGMPTVADRVAEQMALSTLSGGGASTDTANPGLMVQIRQQVYDTVLHVLVPMGLVSCLEDRFGSGGGGGVVGTVPSVMPRVSAELIEDEKVLYGDSQLVVVHEAFRRLLASRQRRRGQAGGSGELLVVARVRGAMDPAEIRRFLGMAR